MDTSRPDTQSETSLIYAPLNQVGMEGIFLPLTLELPHGEMILPSEVSVKVSLDQPDARGIHMSRLYLMIQELAGKKSQIEKLVDEEFLHRLLDSQQKLSQNVYVTLKMQVPVKQLSLKSKLYSWAQIPFQLDFNLIKGEFQKTARFSIDYSSTCPASAALARQLVQENFMQNFNPENVNKANVTEWLGQSTSILATPHAQRSLAQIEVTYSAQKNFSLLELVTDVEAAIQTKVQGAVKREDEQEFALRNGMNLMFCEDVARRVQKVLEARSELIDYSGKFTHFESLHAHNAVSRIQKKV